MFAPLYPGDSAYWENNSHRQYDVDCYIEFTHTWLISNTGSQAWQGRKLVLVNSNEIRPKTSSNSIAIPDTAPHESAEVSVKIDSRGFEGKFRLVWEMQDAEGNNCLPNDNNLFCITIKTAFNQ